MTHQQPSAARAHLAPCNPPSTAKPIDTDAKSDRSCSGACSVAVNGCVTGCLACQQNELSAFAPTALSSGRKATEASRATGDSHCTDCAVGQGRNCHCREGGAPVMSGPIRLVFGAIVALWVACLVLGLQRCAG